MTPIKHHLNLQRRPHVQRELKRARSDIRELSAALESAVQRDGLKVDERTHGDLVSIMKVNSDNVKSPYLENSFPSLFWQQQLQAGSQAKSKLNEVASADDQMVSLHLW